jgi:polyferredoxin
MEKIGRPRGLIRYSSQSAMAGERQRIVRPRVVIYSGIILVAVALLGVLLATRSPADVSVLRNVGRPFVIGADGLVENTMRLHITNRSERAQRYRVAVFGAPESRALMGHETLAVAAGESVTEPVRVLAPAGQFKLGHLDVTLRVSGDDGVRIDRPCRLLGPASLGASNSSTGVTHGQP